MATFTQQTWQDAWPHHLLVNLHDYAVFALDPKGTLTSWHPGVKTLLGFERDAFIGQSIRLIFTEEDVQAGVPEREMAVAREQGRALDERWHLKADGSCFWAVGILAALTSDDGELLGYAKIMRDFTERRAESEARRTATLHDRALAEAGRKLSASLDYPATLQQVAELAVPELADWCAVDLRTPQGEIELVAVAHVNPAKVAWAWELRRLNPPDPEQDRGVPKVIRTGQPEFYPEISRELIEQAARSEQERETIRQVGFKSVIIVPLIAHGQTLGALTLVWSDTDKRYTKADLAFAEELGRRAATAVDNARLYREAQEARDALLELNRTLAERVQEGVATVRQLAAQLTLAENRERHRLAQLLHDELQQELYVAQFAASDLKAKAASLGESVSTALSDKFGVLNAQLKTTVQTARGITTDLSPPILHNEGFYEALNWLAARKQEHYGLKVHLDVPEELPVPHQALRVLLISLIRELLFNVVKHANTDTAWVNVRTRDSELVIGIKDKGCGFDVEQVKRGSGSTGFGLTSIEERLRLFGGRVSINSSPGEGTFITIAVPLSTLTLG